MAKVCSANYKQVRFLILILFTIHVWSMWLIQLELLLNSCTLDKSSPQTLSPSFNLPITMEGSLRAHPYHFSLQCPRPHTVNNQEIAS